MNHSKAAIGFCVLSRVCSGQTPVAPPIPYTVQGIREWHQSLNPWPWHFSPEQVVHIRSTEKSELLLCVGGGARGGEFVLFAKVNGSWSQLSDSINLSHHPAFTLPHHVSGWHDFETFVPLWGSGGKEVLVSTYRWTSSRYALLSTRQCMWNDIDPKHISTRK